LNIAITIAIVAGRSGGLSYSNLTRPMLQPNVSRGGQLIAFGKSLDLVRPLSDADYFAGIEWEASAAAKIKPFLAAHDLERLVAFLLQSASGVNSRNAVRKSADTARQSLWSRPELKESTRAAELIRIWEPRVNSNGGRRNGVSRGLRPLHGPEIVRSLDRWMQSCATGEPLSRIELLVLFEMLRDEAATMPLSLSGRLWRLALTGAIEEIASPAAEQGVSEAEFGWQVGLLFTPVSGAKALAASARDRLGRMLTDSTDSEGVPSPALVQQLPHWLATTLRAREWGRRFSRPLFDSQTEQRFKGLVGAASRLCRGDGRLAFCNGRANGFTGLWSTAAAAISHRHGSSQHAARYLGSLENGSQAPRRSTSLKKTVASKSVRPVFQSDASQLACLRSDWSPEANSLFVSHHGPFPSLELATRGSLLIGGQWDIEVQVSNAAIDISGPWTCSCWYSDDAGDYLELQARPTANVRIERQLLLARNDDWLFLADVVVGCEDERIDYRSRLPLAPRITVDHDRETRALQLNGTDASARLFPIGLPCERVHGCAGQLSDSGRHLELRESGIGGLYAPVVLDWNPTRRRQSAIWRALTVAQNGMALPARDAAGVRLQVGKEQWLIYRSLSRFLEPRTVLGQHTMYETLIGRFLTTGAVEPMVLVEQGTEEAG
jgi:hypothetical protein